MGFRRQANSSKIIEIREKLNCFIYKTWLKSNPNKRTFEIKRGIKVFCPVVLKSVTLIIVSIVNASANIRKGMTMK